ncbi:MAG: histidinol-phosphatase HisJ family protein, partial [Oscillospiraceae bacterium]|nr:histidinol-phosphatase HisJ family protein [Oscillospiraceae bacterium]
HTHTNFSPDSDAEGSKMYIRAKELGLKVWAITDHVELCRYYPQEFYQTEPRNEEDFFDYASIFEDSVFRNHRVQSFFVNHEKQYKDTLFRRLIKDLIFCNGIELGEPNADFQLAERLYQDQRLDFVIASLHELPDRLDFYFLDYQQENIRDLLEQYFEILLEITKHDCYDVLGHLTYPVRYLAEAGLEHAIASNIRHNRDCIAEILKSVIQNGKGIELNTSGYRQAYGRPFPDEDLLKLYKDLGGTILTFGSDAHCPEDLGKGIAEGMALAKSCGFENAAYYLNHNAYYINL